MGRPGRIRAATSACMAVAVWSAPIAGQRVERVATTRPLAVGEQLPGLPARFWVRLIGDAGQLPVHERLVVLTTDGRVLAVLDGGSDAVDIPASVDALLDDTTTPLVLAHNHPADTSLSGADLALLGRPSVERVVAVGHDGSVYEATAGPGFVDRALFARLYPALEARLKTRLAGESAWAGATPGAAFDQFSHLMALILARAGIIQYRARLSVGQLTRAAEYAAWTDRIVTTEAARVWPTSTK